MLATLDGNQFYLSIIYLGSVIESVESISQSLTRREIQENQNI